MMGPGLEHTKQLELEERIALVKERISEACASSGRDANEVGVIAVTKYVSNATAAAAYRLGLNHLGENRWPDAEAKLDEVGQGPVWHFIGSLQSRKVRHVVGKFPYIHSLDRLSLAKEIDKRAAEQDVTVRCFVQVNVSGEATKSGLHPEQVRPFVKELNDYSRIELAGLMTMAPHVEDPERTRPVFRTLRELRDELNKENTYREPLDHLSMGMSNDFEVAIEEGATWIRLGSVLVGKNID